MFRWQFYSGSGVASLGRFELEVKVEYVPTLCYLGDPRGSGGGVKEAVRASARCAWSYIIFWQLVHIKEKTCRARGQSVLTYRTETWAMKAENLKSPAQFWQSIICFVWENLRKPINEGNQMKELWPEEIRKHVILVPVLIWMVSWFFQNKNLSRPP